MEYANYHRTLGRCTGGRHCPFGGRDMATTREQRSLVGNGYLQNASSGPPSLMRVVLKRKFGIHALELRQLGFGILQMPQLGQLYAGELRLSHVVGRFADGVTVLAARYADLRASIDLFQDLNVNRLALLDT